MVGHDVDEFGTNIKGDSAVVCNFLFPVIKRFCFFVFFGARLLRKGNACTRKICPLLCFMFLRVRVECRAYFVSMYIFHGFLLYRLDTSLDGYFLTFGSLFIACD